MLSFLAFFSSGMLLTGLIVSQHSFILDSCPALSFSHFPKFVLRWSSLLLSCNWHCDEIGEIQISLTKS